MSLPAFDIMRDFSSADTSVASSPLSSAPPSPTISSSTLSSARSISPPPEFTMPPVSASRAHQRAGSRASVAYLPSPPASQQTSHNGSPAPDSNASTMKDGPPPAKRRRISKEPKERSTEYLDLRSRHVDPLEQDELDRLMHVLHKRQKIVVIAGAGMSVSAGIPDFRSSAGLFKSLKEEHKLKGSGKDLFDASVYKDDTSTASFHDMVSSMSRLTKAAKPTAFHHMLATIASEDRLLRLYSQNVDGIDTSLDPLKTSVPLRKDIDGKWPRTVQLHGGLDKMVCSKCAEVSDFDATLFDSSEPPACKACETINNLRTEHQGKRSHGIGRLRPRMVLYNEHNPDDEAIGSITREDLRKRPDAVIVVGTTLKVPGVRRIVREMCGVVRDRRGGVAIWINNDPPPATKELEDCFDIVVQGSADAVAKRAAMRLWDELPAADDFSEVSEEDALKAVQKAAEVHVPSSQTMQKSLCKLTHANLVHLPSDGHINNSFLPPSGTPKRVFEFGPKDWSPVTSRRTSVLRSIELDSASEGGETADVKGGYLTPSKSQRSTSPPKKKAIMSLNDRLKDAKVQVPKRPTHKKLALTGAAAKTAIKGVKPRTKAISKSTGVAATTKAAPAKRSHKKKPTDGLAIPPPKSNTLNNAFKTTKSESVAAKSALGKKIVGSSPSKLRKVSNASSEAMQPLSANAAPPAPAGGWSKAFGDAMTGVKRKLVGA